jgi:ATP-binding cassette, subfamily B, bacterial MsbA
MKDDVNKPRGLRRIMGMMSTDNLRIIGRLLGDQGWTHWRGYSFALAMSLVISAMTSAAAYIMKDVIDKIFVDKDPKYLWIIGGAISGIYLIKGFATYAQVAVLARVANAIVADVQTRVFRKMLDMSIGFYNVRHSTEFIGQQTFISSSASGALNLLINVLARDVITLIGLAAVMVSQDPVMAGLALVCTPFAVIGVRRLGGRAKKVMLNEFRGFMVILESLQEVVQGVRVVKAYALEPHMFNRQAAAIESFRKAANKLSAVGARSSPFAETLGGLTIAVVVIYGGYRVIASGQQPGNFFAFITALMLAFEPAKRLARLHIDLTSSLFGVEILYRFLDQPSEEAETGNEPKLELTRGRVEFEDVRFHYRVGEPVIRDLSFVAEAGKMTALVGRSGGGKTTVMNLLLRFYNHTAGEIRIDGQSIAEVSRHSLRSQIAYVSQETFLFKGSIADNIALGRPGATKDEIIAAAKSAYAHDFIMGFDRGYDSPVGEQGMQLSGGQRQRIAIARAIIKNAPIILLDEATSALDTESERAVQAALQDLSVGRTTIVIAHRLSTIVRADKICVIEHGRLVETGQHDELIAQDGVYRRLHEIAAHDDDLIGA